MGKYCTTMAGKGYVILNSVGLSLWIGYPSYIQDGFTSANLKSTR